MNAAEAKRKAAEGRAKAAGTKVQEVERRIAQASAEGRTRITVEVTSDIRNEVANYFRELGYTVNASREYIPYVDFDWTNVAAAAPKKPWYRRFF